MIYIIIIIILLLLLLLVSFDDDDVHGNPVTSGGDDGISQPYSTDNGQQPLSTIDQNIFSHSIVVKFLRLILFKKLSLNLYILYIFC